MSPALGIDLGTYHSSAGGAFDADNVSVVMSSDGPFNTGKNFPSFVQFDSRGSVLHVGLRARNALAAYPESVIWGVKRLVGASYDEVLTRGLANRFAYRVEKGVDNEVVICVGP